jgi:hypothetical protein
LCQPRAHLRGDDFDVDQRRSRATGLSGRMSSCMKSRGTSKVRHLQRGRDSDWYHDKSSQNKPENTEKVHLPQFVECLLIMRTELSECYGKQKETCSRVHGMVQKR